MLNYSLLSLAMQWFLVCRGRTTRHKTAYAIYIDIGDWAMPWRVEHDAELGIVRAIYFGRVTANEFKAGTLETIALMDAHGINLLLIDDTEVELAVSTNDIFEMPQFYENVRAMRSTRWALVHPSDPAAIKHFRFYENVCRNRGWLVKLFSDRQAALDWLLTEPG